MTRNPDNVPPMWAKFWDDADYTPLHGFVRVEFPPGVASASPRDVTLVFSLPTDGATSERDFLVEALKTSNIVNLTAPCGGRFLGVSGVVERYDESVGITAEISARILLTAPMQLMTQPPQRVIHG